MSLPKQKQSRTSVSPSQARVYLVGMPGAGKTTLAGGWAPDDTLIIDTQHGTDFLAGEHYVAHAGNWQTFVGIVDDLVKGGHGYKTVVIDLIDDVWRWADEAHAGKGSPLASATDDWQRSIKTAEGMFTQTIGKLLASDMGVWMLGHADEKQDGQITRYAPKLDKRVKSYIVGACSFVLLAETLGGKRVLHTQPTGRFECKSRVPMPEPMEMDARALWQAMDAGLNPKAVKAAA